MADPFRHFLDLDDELAWLRWDKWPWDEWWQTYGVPLYVFVAIPVAIYVGNRLLP